MYEFHLDDDQVTDIVEGIFQCAAKDYMDWYRYQKRYNIDGPINSRLNSFGYERMRNGESARLFFYNEMNDVYGLDINPAVLIEKLERRAVKRARKKI